MATKWIEELGTRGAPPAVTIKLTRAALEKRPDNASLWMALGEALLAIDNVAALKAYQRAVELDAPRSEVAFGLASAYWATEHFEDALTVIDGSEESSESAFLRIKLLFRTKRPDAAISECWRYVDKFPTSDDVAERLLTHISRSGDGSQLLAACDRLPIKYRNLAACTAFRAVAYSLLDRDDEANALIDLERQVTQFVFEPPESFADLKSFNSILAAEILAGAVFTASPSEVTRKSNDRLENYELGSVGNRTYLHLKPFIEEGIARHIERCRIERSDPLLTRPLLEARLFTGGYGYSGAHHNGCHIHVDSVVTGVYHVSVPGGLEGDVGCLKLGLFPPSLADRTPCWPQRTIRPVPGTMTIFPSYIFHDFVPTGVAEPRVAIGMSIYDAVWAADA